MGSFDWGLELVLVVLLAITLVHAVRLERALRLLRMDRAALGDAIAGFDDNARQAEAGIGRLHSASADTAHALTQCFGKGASLKDDLGFLIERGEALADRLDALVRAGRPIAQLAPVPSVASTVASPSAAAAPAPKVRSKAERDLLIALQAAQ